MHNNTQTLTLPNKAERMHEAAQAIRDHLLNLITSTSDDCSTLRRVQRSTINAIMTSAFHKSNASGAWSQRDSFEAIEYACVLTIRSIILANVNSGTNIKSLLGQLSTLLPNQTVRSETQIRFQQFSTPIKLAQIIALAADVTDTDIILEPSAGTGLLAVFVEQQSKSLLLNERENQRAGILKRIFPNEHIFQFDAEDLSLLKERPTVIIMNPPFSSNGTIEDRYTAARHLQAALTHLEEGGRCVAIMPPSFSASGSQHKAFNRIVGPHHVAANWTIDNGFRAHGTDFQTRLLVIDKYPSIPSNTTSTGALDVNNPDILLNGLSERQIARSKPIPITPQINLLTNFKSKLKTQKPQISPRFVVPSSAEDVTYMVHDEGQLSTSQTGHYLAYKPTRITIANAQPHPSALVESLAMGSIAAPIPTYVPKLPDHLITSGTLSEAQLETVIYALDATSKYLPGTYKLSENELSLQFDPSGKSYRQGYFIGDGTGTGKGRQISSIILDQWLRGNQKHIWITENNPLLEDARRDWTALGGMPLDIQPITQFAPHKPIPFDSGILLVSYPGLRSASGERPRLEQIIEWAGSDFDGVIIFDEAHAMGGAIGRETEFGAKQGSLQGMAGIRLQNHLPDARVIYSSATGADEIANFSYASRLGLWGYGTSFKSRDEFIARISEGGLAALELIARELKGQGLYCARALSYAGVEYDPLIHDLTDTQIEVFDTYANAWGHIHRNLESALELNKIIDPLNGKTLNGQALGAARSRFESCKQRFFSQLILSMKLPSLIPAIQSALDDQTSVLIQLVSTAEALLNRRIDALDDDARGDLMIDLSPREYMIDYLKNAFPTQQLKVLTDDTGNRYSVPLIDQDGHIVVNPDTVALRDNMIEQLCAMPPIVTAIDTIINHFGKDMVAEVTGRTKRLITAKDGTQLLERRSNRACQNDAEEFMNGKRRILVFSDAGGTGRSYHASLAHKNQQRRRHFLLEPGWRANKAIQGLGRSNRTHQASSPIFSPVSTDVRGERRFISTIARRLDALGAITRGQRQTGGQNLFNPADNLESDYAREALVKWLHMLHKGKLKSVSLADFEYHSGLKISDGGIILQDLPPIQRWLNRILAMPINLQNAIFDEYLSLVEARIDAARAAGTLDLGVEVIKTKTLTILNDHILRTDKATGLTSNLLEIQTQYMPRLKSLDLLKNQTKDDKHPAICLYNSRSKRAGYLQFYYSRYNEETGEAESIYYLFGVRNTQTISQTQLDDSHWQPISDTDLETYWQAEYQEASKTPLTETLYLATGQLLPIWNDLSREHLEVRRVVDETGQSYLGRIVDTRDVAPLLNHFGIENDHKRTAKDIIADLFEGRTIIPNPNAKLLLKTSRVNGDKRIEIRHFEAVTLSEYKLLGCFTEIIQWETRLFVPVQNLNDVIDFINTPQR